MLGRGAAVIQGALWRAAFVCDKLPRRIGIGKFNNVISAKAQIIKIRIVAAVNLSKFRLVRIVIILRHQRRRQRHTTQRLNHRNNIVATRTDITGRNHAHNLKLHAPLHRCAISPQRPLKRFLTLRLTNFHFSARVLRNRHRSARRVRQSINQTRPREKLRIRIAVQLA